MSLIHNEQTKLTATLLNSIAVAAIAIGGIPPTVGFIVGTTTLSGAVVSGIVWIAIGFGLHLVARAALRRMIE